MDTRSARGGGRTTRVWRTRLPALARRARVSADQEWILFAGLLAVVAFALLVSRLVGLEQSFWEDEVYTADKFVRRGPRAIFNGNLFIINNHVLYSLGAWLSVQLLGVSEVAYRLVSVLPAIAAVGIVASWAWRRVGPLAGVATAALLTVSPLHLDLSRQARGYGLVFLSAAGMLVAANRFNENGSRRDLALFFVSAAVGVWTFYPVGAQFGMHLVLLLAPRGRRLHVAAGAALFGLATLVFYGPFLRNLIESNPNGNPGRGNHVDFEGMLTLPVERLLQPIAEMGIRGAGPAATAFVVAAVLAVSGAVYLWRTGQRWALWHTVLPIAGPFLLYFLRGSWLFDRYLAMHLVAAVALMAVGVHAAVCGLWRLPWLRAPVIAGVTVVTLVVGDAFADLTRDLSRLPRENFKEVAALVDRSGITAPVLTNDGSPYVYNYYLKNTQAVEMTSEELSEAVCAVGRPAVFIDSPLRASRRDEPPDLSCLDDWEAVRINVPQRAGKDGITVWLAP